MEHKEIPPSLEVQEESGRNCEVLGVLEFVKLQLIEDFNQLEEVE
jgi:hypothetical protein